MTGSWKPRHLALSLAATEAIRESEMPNRITESTWNLSAATRCLDAYHQWHSPGKGRNVTMCTKLSNTDSHGQNLPLCGAFRWDRQWGETPASSRLELMNHVSTYIFPVLAVWNILITSTCIWIAASASGQRMGAAFFASSENIQLQEFAI